MNAVLQLTARPRTTGSAASRRLRRAGLVPGIIYGPGVTSLAVSLNRHQLERLLEKHGRGHLIQLHVEEEPQPRQVLIKDLQRDIVSHQVLHVDFLQVDMNRAIRLRVPVVVVGEEQVQRRGLIVTHELNEVEIECRPTEVPAALTLDISAVAEPGPVTAARLTVPPGVRLLEDPETVIVSCTAGGAAGEAGEAEAEASAAPAG